jgi:hypothetical protein
VFALAREKKTTGREHPSKGGRDVEGCDQWRRRGKLLSARFGRAEVCGVERALAVTAEAVVAFARDRAVHSWWHVKVNAGAQKTCSRTYRVRIVGRTGLQVDRAAE